LSFSESDRIRLQHMLEAARRAVRLADGRERADLDDEDDPLGLALVQLVGAIGEAAYKVTPEGRAEIEDIPWPDIVGMRHRLIHAYYDINYEILWATVKVNLPDLIRTLEATDLQLDQR
jgi:uncharacterized protein with HEPN domain